MPDGRKVADNDPSELVRLVKNLGVKDAVKARPSRIVTLRQRQGCLQTAGEKDARLVNSSVTVLAVAGTRMEPGSRDGESGRGRERDQAVGRGPDRRGGSGLDKSPYDLLLSAACGVFRKLMAIRL